MFSVFPELWIISLSATKFCKTFQNSVTIVIIVKDLKYSDLNLQKAPYILHYISLFTSIYYCIWLFRKHRIFLKSKASIFPVKIHHV